MLASRPPSRPLRIKSYWADKAGYAVIPERVFAETISGTIPAMERSLFVQAINKLERGNVLVVAKLDRLGSNASDIDRTVEHLNQMGVRVIVLDLPVMELTSAAVIWCAVCSLDSRSSSGTSLSSAHMRLARAKAESETPGPEGCPAQVC